MASSTTAFLNTTTIFPPLQIKIHKNNPKIKPEPPKFINPNNPISSSLNQTPKPQPQDFITNITKLLWGKSLPPQLLISTLRATWNSTWLLMMSQLAPSDSSGSYSRPASKFRADLKPLSISRLKKPGNLHLYVGLPCPWAHRTLIVRALKNLEELVPVSIASPGKDGSWEFDNGDELNGCRSLREVYKLQREGYEGRSTVPMLWDVGRKGVLCNESYDIIELFNSGFGKFDGNPSLDLSPPMLKERIQEWNRVIYPNVNNGVYRCGFAQSQEAYDIAVDGLFNTLDMIDGHLANSRYLCGDGLTLADVCLFTTLIRFDLVYNILFKCTKKKLREYTNLYDYMRDIYQIPKVAATCNFDAIMDGYYKILFPLNPGSILPAMPSVCESEVLSESHNRESVTSDNETIQLHTAIEFGVLLINKAEKALMAQIPCSGRRRAKVVDSSFLCTQNGRGLTAVESMVKNPTNSNSYKGYPKLTRMDTLQHQLTSVSVSVTPHPVTGSLLPSVTLSSRQSTSQPDAET
ncbi:hypothetical protein GIB67_041741 [Kingdonia uniflora]|uniref:GST C-terminal domain-containing protein n=1 Tax=Kingdonia uniflora TaxID=39325 RepID=A0A7J7NNQ6_9MAGN|nr:hypothetical protein GIB67_041741 [Kingdonia uniflora]